MHTQHVSSNPVPNRWAREPSFQAFHSNETLRGMAIDAVNWIPGGSIGSSTYVLHVHRTVTLSKEVGCTIPPFAKKTS